MVIESTSSMSSGDSEDAYCGAVSKASHWVPPVTARIIPAAAPKNGRPRTGPFLRPNLKRGGVFYIYWTDHATGRSRERSTKTRNRTEAERYFANWRPNVQRMFQSKKEIIGWVYFIRAPSAIKVGFASDVVKRFANIQTANPDELILLGAIRGTYLVEQAIRAELREHHLRGEWLRASPEVERYIAQTLAEFKDAQQAAPREAAE